jgi:integrase
MKQDAKSTTATPTNASQNKGKKPALVALTEQQQHEAPPKGRSQRLPPGITARTSATTGKTTYQVRVRDGVRRNQALTHTAKTLAEAKAWQAQAIASLNNNEPITTKKHRRITIAEAIADYIKRGVSGKKDKPISEGELLQLNKLAEEFKGLGVLELTPTKLQAWKRELLKTEVPTQERKKLHPLYNGDQARTYSKSTARKYFYTLKKVLESDARFKGYPFNSPFPHVIAPAESEDDERTRRLEKGEEAKLLGACLKMYSNKEAWQILIKVALETAMRAGELLSLHWSDVRFHERRILLRKENTKTKVAREIPITTPCEALLTEYRKTHGKDDEPRIFYQWTDSHALGQRFKVITKNAQMEDFHFHDLRHEATSRFYERSTLRDTEIARITGHKLMKTLRRYSNLRTQDLAGKLW